MGNLMKPTGIENWLSEFQFFFASGQRSRSTQFQKCGKIHETHKKLTITISKFSNNFHKKLKQFWMIPHLLVFLVFLLYCLCVLANSSQTITSIYFIFEGVMLLITRGDLKHVFSSEVKGQGHQRGQGHQ